MDVPVGGLREGQILVRNPTGDGWIAQTPPGAEIGYAEYTAGNISVPTTATQISALQIAIPAGTGPYWVEFGATFQGTATATNGIAICFAEIRDESNVVLAVARTRAQIPVSAQVWEIPAFAKRRMAATDTAKTLSIWHLATLSSATANMVTGVGTDLASPAYITAYIR